MEITEKELVTIIQEYHELKKEREILLHYIGHQCDLYLGVEFMREHRLDPASGLTSIINYIKTLENNI